MRNGKIDIIIPAYNVKDSLLQNCLTSIALQTLKDLVKVTIVDDASTEENYKNIVNNLSYTGLDIQILKLEKNQGPGVARQYGLDHTENEFVVFVDADDLLPNSFALEKLKQAFESDKGLEIIIGSFEEIIYVNNELTSIIHSADMIWVFGKMYRRSFIQDYNIKFHETSRANEDNGFNTLCRLYIGDNNCIGAINDIVYCWHPSENSITRKNQGEYGFSSKKDANFFGYVENMIYAINTAQNSKFKVHEKGLKKWAITVMVRIYWLYCSILQRLSEQEKEEILSYCAWYYNEIYIKFKDSVPEPEIINIYINVTKAFLEGADSYFIPELTFPEFLNIISKIK